jgi:hypothetical protein
MGKRLGVALEVQVERQPRQRVAMLRTPAGQQGDEIRLDQYPSVYGIACKLVTGHSPQDRIPSYNLLHYNSNGPYFEERNHGVNR